ncbi:hypothetical protein Lpp230_1037 [Lacticaseibacillus paracasei subsp. paracasei Lpp230]|nr:hypothetical protein Lpp230_1037 [Lacticaseibacillus paracasei subsp. paracasei Lpp230]
MLGSNFLPCQTPQSPASCGWNAVTALRAQKPVSKSPNNISDKARSLCCLHG